MVSYSENKSIWESLTALYYWGSLLTSLPLKRCRTEAWEGEVQHITSKTQKTISSQGLSLYLGHKLPDKYKEVAKFQLGIENACKYALYKAHTYCTADYN